MILRRQTLSGILLLVLSACSAGCATRSISSGTAASSADDWSAVMRLKNGTVLKVDGSTGIVSGRLVAVDPDRLTIAVGRAQQLIARSDIHRLASLHRTTGKRARLGLLIGAIVGSVQAILLANAQGEWIAGLAGGWGAIGAAIGAAEGFGIWEETLVYFSSSATWR